MSRTYIGVSRIGLILASAMALLACGPALNDPLTLESARFSGVGPGRTYEVKIAEPQGEVPLIVVQGYEAELEVRLFSAAGEELAHAHIPYRRMSPYYLVSAAAGEASSLQVQVNIVHSTRDASINVKAHGLPAKSRGDRKRVEAYRAYSKAIASTESSTADEWRPRVAALTRASALFRSVNMLEQALWADSLNARFSYYPLYEYPASIQLARRTAERAEHAGFAQIKLLNLITEGQALMERASGETPEETDIEQELAQARFHAASALADELGMQFEQSWALNGRGTGYYYWGQPQESMVWHQKALSLAEALGDQHWTNMVAGNLAIAREGAGDFAGALATLTEINRSLRQSGDVGALAYNLTELGRIYRHIYRFGDSIEYLTEAREIAQPYLSTDEVARIGLWLGLVYYAMGHLDRSETILTEHLPIMRQAGDGRMLREAHQTLANIARLRRKFDLMTLHRSEQARYLGPAIDQARFHMDSGLDALAVDSTPGAAHQHFRRSFELNVAAEYPDFQRLARLRMCGTAGATSDRINCEHEALRLDHERLQRSPILVRRLEAMQAWANWLTRQGLSDESLAVLDELVATLARYRRKLPGVLGAWYWESRTDIFDAYLNQVIRVTSAKQRGIESLLALHRLRSIGRLSVDPPNTARDAALAEVQLEVRKLQAEREQAANEADRERVEHQIDRLLLGLAQPDTAAEEVDASQLSGWLRDLPPDSVVLAYHFSRDGNWVWVASQDGVELSELARGTDLQALVESTRDAIRAVGDPGLETQLRDLGDALVGALPRKLPSKVFLLSGGALNGFPFDALLENGQHLALNHDVAQLADLRSITGLSVSAVPYRHVFMAGNPLLAGTSHPGLPYAGSELSIVQEQFKNASTWLVEGADLKIETFSGAQFAEADLIHIASHAEVDMSYPELSSLALGSGGGASRALAPMDLIGLQLAARLVVLSACETVGSTRFQYDANLGFVTEFLRAGAQNVIASLWPVSDRAAFAWARDFYGHLAQGQGPVDALYRTKRNLLGNSDGASIAEWTAFQIVIGARNQPSELPP